MKLRMKLFVVWLVLILFASLSSPAFSQLSVVSTFPANGATSVNTTVTLAITFSVPLDTTVRFAYPQDLFLNLVIQPDSQTGPPDSITLSPDLRTVYAHNLHLWPDTEYLFLITDAVSIANDSLAMPYLATFTTGSSLPTSSVSGIVTFPGENVAGIAVALLNASLFSDEESETESGTIVQTVSGKYQINYVSPGTYWPVAIKDYYIDGDGELQPLAMGGMGFYDPDADGIPDSIVVADGQQLSGINISLFSLAPVTARFNYPAITNFAQAWANDAALVMLGTEELSPSGEAMTWMYAFYSPSLATYCGWATIGTHVMAIEMSDPPQSTTLVSSNWLDSDVVADSAEARGGSDFRTQYPDAGIMAFLGVMPNSQLQSSTTKSPDRIHALAGSSSGKRFSVNSIMRQAKKMRFSFPKNHSLQEDRAVWGFSYFSAAAGQQILLIFDAATGEYLQPSQPEETTARYNLDAANQSAQSWALDAELVMVGIHQSELNALGQAAMWFYIYNSASLDSQQVFVLSNGVMVFQGPIWQPPSKTVLPSDWIDSDVAINIAENNGGSQYRTANNDIMVSGGLSRGLLPGQQDRAVWRFEYTSSTAAPLDILVDGVTGEFIPPWTPTPTTARFNLNAANQTAGAWATDAALMLIMARNVPVPDSKAMVWSFIYYSADKDLSMLFNMVGGICPGGAEPFQHGIPSKTPLPSDWIDSPAAVAAAEANGGSQYRSLNQNVQANVNLSFGLYAPDITRAVWGIEYSSTSAPILQIYIDALTGQIITSVDKKSDNDLPDSYALSQNHPNPFNPETVIQYQLPKASDVEISIFNMQGQIVTRWVSNRQSAGIHKIIWNGKDESGHPVGSGVYVYRFKADDFVEMKKMLLLR